MSLPAGNSGRNTGLDAPPYNKKKGGCIMGALFRFLLMLIVFPFAVLFELIKNAK